MTDLTTNTSDRFFIDSNILVYSYDDAEPNKKILAQEIIASLARNGSGALSVQVLGKFFNIATRRIPIPLTADEATTVIDYMSRSLAVIDIDSAMVRRAIATHRCYGTSYWDSLIITAAERAGCTKILSEDMNRGQSYHGMEAVNPFL